VLFAAMLLVAASPAKPPPPVPAEPQQTTASFGDWTLRCTRSAAASQICEVVQSITNEDRPVAQFAFGRVGKAQPLHLTILVPPNISLGSNPVLATSHDGDPPIAEFSWRRCLPGGCFADTSLSAETLLHLRGATDPDRVTFPNAAGRTEVLPFSPRGLSQALDALAKADPDISAAAR
jgi:invasion protein IalB